jgi:hypothetical protein
MERVAEILRALLGRALSEYGPQAPALADVLIERAQNHLPPQVGVQLSNGYRAWAPLSPADCYAFCESRGTWDLASLRAALLREGQYMYLELREDHAVSGRNSRQRREDRSRFGASDNGASLLARLRQEADGLNQDPIWHHEVREFPCGAARSEAARSGRFEPRSEIRSETGRRLLQWWAQRREQLVSSFAFLRASGDVGSKRAQERGLRLLRDNLTPLQRQQYERYGYFDVLGGNTGKRYRIRHGRQMNIDQLDKNGRRVCGWCFFPQGNLVAGDIMLAQKIALELYEVETLRIANRY